MIELSNQEDLKKTFEEQKDKPLTEQSVIICSYCNKYHWRYDQCPKVMHDLINIQKFGGKIMNEGKLDASIDSEHKFKSKNEGRKYDKGKTQWHKAPWELFEKIVKSVMEHPEYRWDLLPVEPLENLVEILTYGAQKYEPNNWQNVEPLRYFDALIRHLIEDFIRGENNDQESKKGHAKHMHCNAMFLDWIKTKINCKHSMIDKLSKHCVNCGKSLVDIDKERRES